MYRAKPKGKAKIAEYQRRYPATPQGKAKMAENQWRYRATPEGKAKKAEHQRRYRAVKRVAALETEVKMLRGHAPAQHVFCASASASGAVDSDIQPLGTLRAQEETKLDQEIALLKCHVSDIKQEGK